MTDKEIIKALELCPQQNGSIPCYDCPCWNDDEQKCKGIDYTATLDLINRQKAEIERLQKEIENLQNVISNQQIEISEKIEKQIKAEAYKEFAERLKNMCKEIITQEWNKKVAPVSWSHAYANFIGDIDNLLKEMVGEEE